MPFTPQTPENKSVEVVSTQAKDIDTFDILQLDMHFDPNDDSATHAFVTWASGYMDAGTFVEVHRDRCKLEGASFITAITAAVDGGKNIYDNVKYALWDYMVAQGVIPTGTVS
jgi:hypothetical protein